jgi:hypothetical protein
VSRRFVFVSCSGQPEFCHWNKLVCTRRLVYMQPHKLTRACAPEQWRSFFVLETKPCHS